jgi:flavin-dependent dehydrogenase
LEYALASGELAGKVAVDAIVEGEVSGEELMEYDQGWRAEFGAELKIEQLLHSSLKTSPDRKMDALLGLLVDDAKLQRAFINIFMGVKLPDSLKVFFSVKEVKRIFGHDTVEKILALRKTIKGARKR